MKLSTEQFGDTGDRDREPHEDRESVRNESIVSERQGFVWVEATPWTYLVPFSKLLGQKEKQRQGDQGDHGEGERPPEHEPQQTQPTHQVPQQQAQLLT